MEWKKFGFLPSPIAYLPELLHPSSKFSLIMAPSLRGGAISTPRFWMFETPNFKLPSTQLLLPQCLDGIMLNVLLLIIVYLSSNWIYTYIEEFVSVITFSSFVNCFIILKASVIMCATCCRWWRWLVVAMNTWWHSAPISACWRILILSAYRTMMETTTHRLSTSRTNRGKVSGSSVYILDQMEEGVVEC